MVKIIVWLYLGGSLRRPRMNAMNSWLVRSKDGDEHIQVSQSSVRGCTQRGWLVKGYKLSEEGRAEAIARMDAVSE